jgi:hypothetical protein
MKTVIAGIIVALLFACNAQARLGETEKQIIQRYGEPIPEMPRLLNYNGKGHWGTFFRFNGYIISVVFDVKSVCVREAYSRCDGFALTEAEMLKFLEINAKGNKWNRLPDINLPKADQTGLPDSDMDSPEWIRSDDQVKAFYNYYWKVFVVSRFAPRQPQSHNGPSLQGF